MDLQAAVAAVALDNEGVVVPLTDRNGNPDLDASGVQSTITVLGEYAEKVGKTMESQTRAMWKRRAGSFDPVTVTKANRIETAAAACIAWSGIMDNGEPLACTKENAVRLLAAAPWILKQVEAAIDNPASFFVKPSTV